MSPRSSERLRVNISLDLLSSQVHGYSNRYNGLNFLIAHK